MDIISIGNDLARAYLDRMEHIHTMDDLRNLLAQTRPTLRAALALPCPQRGSVWGDTALDHLPTLSPDDIGEAFDVAKARLLQMVRV